MLAKIKTNWNILLIVGVTLGIVITGNMGEMAQAADN